MTENEKQDKPRIFPCPNCNHNAILQGKTIICENCDATYRITREGTKIEKVGAIADHESRLRVLEEKAGLNQATQPEPEPEPKKTKSDEL